MSDFSNKCREYLKDTGENVYQLSASSGLDRTSLQRMITGKRLPGIDFVRQFCDSLRINPSHKTLGGHALGIGGACELRKRKTWRHQLGFPFFLDL